MCRNVARADLPFECALGCEAVEVSGRHVVRGVAYEDLLGFGIDGQAVGQRDLLLGAVCDEVVRNDALFGRIVYGIGDLVAARRVAPLGADRVEPVVVDAHLAGCDAEVADDLLRGRVDHVDVRSRAVVVAARADVDAAVAVQLHAVEVDCHIDRIDDLQRLEVHHRHRAVVVREAVSPRVGHIEPAARDDHLFGLVADNHLARDREAFGVDLDDLARPRFGVDLHGAGIGADVGPVAFEDDVSAVRYRDAADVLGRMYVHDLHEVRAVHHHIEPVLVDGDVVPHVAQLLHHVGVALRVDVALVTACAGIEVVDRALVAAHVALVHEEETLDPFGRGRRGDVFGLGADHRYLLAASGHRQQGGQGRRGDCPVQVSAEFVDRHRLFI